MTDTTLEAAALSWLRYERRCFLVCLGRNPHKELCIPDVLGLGPDRKLIEIEIKRTMADFRQNGNKRGLKWRTYWPKQFYFLVPPKIAERVKCELKAGLFDETYERAGLLTLHTGLENAYTGLPYLEALIPAPVNKAAVKLSVHAVGRMIRHQSGTLAKLAAINAVRRNDERTNDGDSTTDGRSPESGAEGDFGGAHAEAREPARAEA